MNIFCNGKRIEVKACNGIGVGELISLLDKGWELNLQVEGYTMHYKTNQSGGYIKASYRNSPLLTRAPEFTGEKILDTVSLLLEFEIEKKQLDKYGNIVKLCDE